MAPKKIAKQFVYEGLGFRVTLLNVPMVKVRETWTPKVDYNELMKNVLVKLANSPSRLTGNQIRFIRNYFQLSLKQFGDYFDVSHAAVIKWEKAENQFPPIKWPVEKDIRLFVLDELKSNSRTFQGLYRRLRDKSKMGTDIQPLEMDVGEEAVSY